MASGNDRMTPEDSTVSVTPEGDPSLGVGNTKASSKLGLAVLALVEVRSSSPGPRETLTHGFRRLLLLLLLGAPPPGEADDDGDWEPAAARLAEPAAAAAPAPVRLEGEEAPPSNLLLLLLPPRRKRSALFWPTSDLHSWIVMRSVLGTGPL